MFNIQNSVTEENEFFAKYDKSYLEVYDEMFMITYLYLQRHRSIEGYVNLTIKDFLLYYNMIPDRKKGRINDKVKNTFQLMVDQEFICYIGCFSNGGLSSVKDVDCGVKFNRFTIQYDEVVICFEETDEYGSQTASAIMKCGVSLNFECVGMRV